jgi:CheY-like chemotaxis protein
MDIRMPVMGGMEAARQIIAECGTDALKLVAISASTLRHEQQVYFDAGFEDFIGKPFRFERMCECLATLLGVEFERGEPKTQLQTSEVSQISEVSMPEDLWMRLKTAAELYKVTDLKTDLTEVEGLGSAGQRLAERLRELIRRYDMEGVLKVLSEIKIDE